MIKKIKAIKNFLNNNIREFNTPEGRTIITNDGYICIAYQSGLTGDFDMADTVANYGYTQCCGFKFEELNKTELEFYTNCYQTDCDDCEHITNDVCECCGQDIDDTRCSKEINKSKYRRINRFELDFNCYLLHKMKLLSDVIGKPFKTFINIEKRVMKFEYDGVFTGYMMALNTND